MNYWVDSCLLERVLYIVMNPSTKCSFFCELIPVARVRPVLLILSQLRIVFVLLMCRGRRLFGYLIPYPWGLQIPLPSFVRCGLYLWSVLVVSVLPIDLCCPIFFHYFFYCYNLCWSNVCLALYLCPIVVWIDVGRFLRTPSAVSPRNDVNLLLLIAHISVVTIGAPNEA